MKVLFFTNMYPFPEMPYCGVFIKHPVDAMRAVGTEVDVLFVNGRKGRINYVKSLSQVRQAVSKKQYDVIHCHHHYCSILARLAGVRLPMVYTCHAGAVMTRPVTRALANLSVRLADYSVMVSEEQVPFLNLRKGRWQIIPCGVDFDRFVPVPRDVALARLGLPANKKYVLFPADPNRPEKRFDIAERTVNLLRNRLPDVEMLILNNIEYSEVPTYFSASDAMIFVSDHEGSPMVIKEAVIAGLPIVSVDVGDVKRTIGGLESCYLVEREPQLLAEKLIEAIQSGRPKHNPSFMDRYDVRTTTRQLLDIYHSLIEKRSKRGA